jgi:hypothetical protein
MRSIRASNRLQRVDQIGLPRHRTLPTSAVEPGSRPMNPLRTGIALAITVALFYALCTAAWAMAPGPFLALMNNLFHGLDFSPLVQSQPFAFSGFVGPLLVLVVWALGAGAFFAWISNRLNRWNAGGQP